MQIIKYFKNPKKLVLFAVLAGVLVASGMPVATTANQQQQVTPLVETGKEMTGIMAAIMGIIAKLLALIAGAVDFAVNLGNDILSLPAVKAGWEIVLNFANLGFILAIIVIAFSTILHLENYAIKQTLWKLIVAALLVNFSLVIAGGFISVSNIAYMYFKSAITDGALTNALINALNPNAFATPPDENTIQAIWDTIKDPFGRFINLMAGLFFIIVFSALIILVFATLFIMLLVRAIALIFLVILSPIIWLCWIFPNTQKYWTQWWQEFIRWNFFAPAVFFFIFLSIATANCMNPNQYCSFTEKKGETLQSITMALEVSGSAAEAFNKSIPAGTKQAEEINKMKEVGFFTHVANLFVVLGLLVGGIYIANKFSIIGGNIGVNLASKAGKGAAGWAGRKGVSGLRRTGVRALGNEFMREKVGAKLQKLGSGLDPNTWKGKLGRFAIGMTGANKLGNLIQAGGARQGEVAVKDVEKKYGHLSDKELGKRMHQFNIAERQWALQKMAKNDTLGMVAGGVSQYITDSEKNAWARYGQGKQFGDLEKSFGADTKTIKAIKDGDDNAARTAMTDFRKKHNIKDYDKLSGNILSNFHETDNNLGLTKDQHDNLKKLVQNSIFDQHPGAVSKARVKLKGENLMEFQNEVDKYIDKFENSTLPEKLRGIDVPIKVKLKWIKEEMPQSDEQKAYWSNWASGMYGARKNFAGTLFGGYQFFGEKEEEKT